MYVAIAYLVAWVPLIFAVHALGYFICVVTMLWECFRRPRATVAVYSNACGAVGFTAIAVVLVQGIYAMAAWVDYDPTWALLATAACPGLSICRWLFPLLRRDAERQSRGERSRLQSEMRAVADADPVPRQFEILFRPLRWRARAPTPAKPLRKVSARPLAAEPPLLSDCRAVQSAQFIRIPPRIP